jgi:hypothetical protein
MQMSMRWRLWHMIAFDIRGFQIIDRPWWKRVYAQHTTVDTRWWRGLSKNLHGETTERIQSQVGDSQVEMTLGWKALNQLNLVHVLNHLSEIISLKLKSRSLSFGFRGSLPFVNNRVLILLYQNNVSGWAWSQGSTGRSYLIRFGLKISLLQRRKPSFRDSCIHVFRWKPTFFFQTVQSASAEYLGIERI